tara:strand:- start:2170 stop:2640 length:471 start_codon:yes stop_codon:yes gene_type:complete
MPFYNYACKKCEEITTELFSMKLRKKWIKCPECGGRAYHTMAGQRVYGQVKDPSVKRTLSDADARKMAKEGQESLVDDTKEALKAKSGTSPYSKMTLTEEGVKQLQKEGVAQKMTDAQKRNADETRAAVVRDAAQKMSSEQKKAITDRTGTKQDSL